MQTPDLDRIARKRAGAKLGFYLHAAIFTFINGILFFINKETSAYAWHLWPLMGWGIGLSFHALAVFFLGSGSPLRQRMIEKERQLLRDNLR
jgi:hypothetical protein